MCIKSMVASNLLPKINHLNRQFSKSCMLFRKELPIHHSYLSQRSSMRPK